MAISLASTPEVVRAQCLETSQIPVSRVNSSTYCTQPSGETFNMLEDLMLLEAGRLAYFGTTRNATTFFDSLSGACPPAINPAGALGAERHGTA